MKKKGIFYNENEYFFIYCFASPFYFTTFLYYFISFTSFTFLFVNH